MGKFRPVTFTENGATVTTMVEHFGFAEAHSRGLGILYFIECAGLIKIGFSKRSLVQRLKDFKTGNPSKITLCLFQWGTMDDEKDLHKTFASDRVHGEWFRPSNELKQYILDWGGFLPDGLA